MSSGASVTQLAAEEKRRLLADLLSPDSWARLAGGALRDELSLRAHRCLFPALTGKAYFNYGARGPLPRPALDAIVGALQESERVGPFSHEALLLQEATAEALRTALAEVFSVPVAAVALTESTTSGCNAALWGVDWRPGDHLLLSDSEHLSAIAVAQEIRDRFGVHLTYFTVSGASRSQDVLDAFDRALRTDTRLVVASHVLWNTGAVMPLAAMRGLARERTAGRCQILVDGAQAAGLLDGPVDADFYAFPANKWFGGPAGVAALIAGTEARARVRPACAGWRGAVVSQPDGTIRWRDDARRYEGGVAPHGLYAGWHAAMRVQHEWGDAATRSARARRMASVTWDRLRTMRDRAQLPEDCLQSAVPPQAGIITLRATDPHAAVRRLEAEGVYTRVIPYPSSVRVCVHYLTADTDVQRLADALPRALSHEP